MGHHAQCGAFVGSSVTLSMSPSFTTTVSTRIPVSRASTRVQLHKDGLRVCRRPIRKPQTRDRGHGYVEHQRGVSTRASGDCTGPDVRLGRVCLKHVTVKRNYLKLVGLIVKWSDASVTEDNRDTNRGRVPRYLFSNVLDDQHAIAERDLSLAVRYKKWWSPGSTADWLRRHLSTAAGRAVRFSRRATRTCGEQDERGHRRVARAAGSGHNAPAW
jgi:hypothetical protein